MHNNFYKKINIPSINYHLWRPCNMKCKFCFATFQDSINILPKGHLSREESMKLIDEIINAGFEKITFAGGEPTLCKWLPDLIKKAKSGGLTTMIVTNGTFLTDSYLNKLKDSLDWITLSIDSLADNTNKVIGRVQRKNETNLKFYKKIIYSIRKLGFKLKINTVVTSANLKEDFTKFIEEVHPLRWKIFQVLPIKGENDQQIESLKITEKEFKHFLKKHVLLEKAGIDIVPESNDAMTASYVMIDPAGRFYDNSKGTLYYSEEILKVGINSAYEQICVSEDKFIERKGIYEW